MPITIKRKSIRFNPDPTRIISRFLFSLGRERSYSIMSRVLSLSDEEVDTHLKNVLRNFSKRHRNISKIFETNFIQARLTNDADLKSVPESMQPEFDELNLVLHELEDDLKPEAQNRRFLIGAYFTMEYAIESAAFFNPSIVEHPDQTELLEDQKRVVLSFRATGEGHISSIVFREGIIDKDHDIHFKSISKLVDVPEIVKSHVYIKKLFFRKLHEMNIYQYMNGKTKEPGILLIEQTIEFIMNKLSENFTYDELRIVIDEAMKSPDLSISEKTAIEAVSWLANSHYSIEFSLDTSLSERVIFPISHTERNGIEDARFVRFTDDDGTVTYCATYTAYDGFTILPKFIQTKDFYNFDIKPLNGIYAQNKGMALFPRKIDGKFVMLSRYDGVNNYIMYSDNINLWQNASKIESPVHPWEYVQTGNCGSPLETEKGWLMLTHGVGPMRRYCIGAMLLDLNDPTRVLGHLKEPLLGPNEEEREGYVPNVVYSCGSMIHNNELILPYGVSDAASTFATVSIDELLAELTGES